MVDAMLPGLVDVQVYDNDDPATKKRVRKPNPDMFWMAAQKLDLQPEQYPNILVGKAGCTLHMDSTAHESDYSSHPKVRTTHP